MYQYKTIQDPPNIQVNKKNANTAAASYLQQIMDTYATDGWEFYSIETIGIQVKAGCLAAIFGAGGHFVSLYVVVFRKLKL